MSLYKIIHLFAPSLLSSVFTFLHFTCCTCPFLRMTTDHPHSSQSPRRKAQSQHLRLTTKAVTCYERSMFPCVMWHFLHYSNNLLSMSGRFENGVEASVSLFTVQAGSRLWPHDVRRRQGVRYSRLARRRYCLNFQSLPVTWCTNSLTFNKCTVRSVHTVFMCFVFIWEQTATCATYSIN